MAQSDARFGYRAKMSREEHDLSRAFGFTTAPGMLNPIFADIATPGDSYYIQHDLDFLRTAPLLAPSMIDVKVHYETFFVPFQMIYEPIENTAFSLKNFRSSLYSDPALLNQSFPLLRLQYYVNSLYTQNSSSPLHMLAFRFADLMGCNPYAFTIDGFTADSSGGINFTGTSQLFYFPSFFPWKALAYHTIFQHYFRLDDKSQFSNFNANWDQYYATHYVDLAYNAGASQAADNTGAIFTIYQRPWNFDYFSSIYRSPIVSDANLQSVLASSSYSALSGNSTTVPLSTTRSVASVNSITASFGSGVSSAFNQTNLQGLGSTSLIRQAFANEKLAMITGRTKKNYDSQVLAHFGIKVPHDVKHDVTLVGRDTYDLRVGEVTSLATTQTGDTVNALGELAGKGWASGRGKKIKFTAPCHGIMMTIFSIEPMRRYGCAIERNSMIDNAFDLPIPEFDRLGNQPMYLYEQSVVDQNQSPNYGSVIGWKERYYWWKRSFDKVTLAFMPVIYNSATVPAVNNYLSYFLTYNPFGRKTTNNAYPSLERTFYIDRNCLNDQFAVPFVDGWVETESENWNKHPFKVYQRDPFIVNSNVKVKKVSWMSKDGEPIYPY